jgi:hypothetical protein
MMASTVWPRSARNLIDSRRDLDRTRQGIGTYSSWLMARGFAGMVARLSLSWKATTCLVALPKSGSAGSKVWRSPFSCSYDPVACMPATRKLGGLPSCKFSKMVRYQPPAPDRTGKNPMANAQMEGTH